MPRRDTIHETVVCALESAGWTITHDPFGLPWQDQLLHVDLAAERPPTADFLAAEQNGRRIAVEIKSFLRDQPPPTWSKQLVNTLCTIWYCGG